MPTTPNRVRLCQRRLAELIDNLGEHPMYDQQREAQVAYCVWMPHTTTSKQSGETRQGHETTIRPHCCGDSGGIPISRKEN